MKPLHGWMAVGLLSVGLLASHRLSRIQQTGASTRLNVHLHDFPGRLGVWKTAADVKIESDVLAVLGLDDWLMRQYRDDENHGLELYIGYLDSWNGQKRRQTIHSPQFCYTGAGWEILENQTLQGPVLRGASIPITRMLLRKGTIRQDVLYWYQWGGQVAAEESAWDYGAKLQWMLQLPFNLARSERTDRALVRVSAPVVDSAEETLKRSLGFVHLVFPTVARRFSLIPGGSR